MLGSGTEETRVDISGARMLQSLSLFMLFVLQPAHATKISIQQAPEQDSLRIE